MNTNTNIKAHTKTLRKSEATRMENKQIPSLPVSINVPSNAEYSFYKYLSEINRIPSLTPEEEFMLAKNFLEHQDLEAAHKLVRSHLKLVAKIALTYKNYGLPVGELVSEGNIGLMQAVKKFNPDLGFRLSTYAMWWIKAAIQEYVLKSWSMVKIGTTAAQKKLFFSLNKIKNKLFSLHARSINNDDYEEIANTLGVSKQEVIEMDKRLSGGDISLNNKMYSGEGEDSSELIEFIPENRPNQEVMLSNRQHAMIRAKLLDDALKTLDTRELRIFKERRLKEEPATLEELSNEYNVSKERIRQIENRAFEKVQTFMLAGATA